MVRKFPSLLLSALICKTTRFKALEEISVMLHWFRNEGLFIVFQRLKRPSQLELNNEDTSISEKRKNYKQEIEHMSAER